MLQLLVHPICHVWLRASLEPEVIKVVFAVGLDGVDLFVLVMAAV